MSTRPKCGCSAELISVAAVGKNYVYRRYGIQSATYEVSDETDREATRCTAVVFAEELMQLMLETFAEARR